jgi:hypothetical protein
MRRWCDGIEGRPHGRGRPGFLPARASWAVARSWEARREARRDTTWLGPYVVSRSSRFRSVLRIALGGNGAEHERRTKLLRKKVQQARPFA